MTLNNAPSSSPLLRSLEALTPEQQREQVKTMRAAEMQNLVEELKNDPTAPARETQEAIERRMAELGMAVDMKSVKEGTANATQGITDKAETSFSAKLMEKAGGWGVVGTGLLAVLSWFGFKKAKALRESLKTKGYLGTAIEGAKEHPIFAALIAGLGIPTSFAAYKYIQNNAEPITEAIADKAKEMGIPGVDAAKSVADRLRAIIGTGADIGLKATVSGIASVLGGTYDEETGVVTLGHKTLHAPVLVAYEAGVRRRLGEGLMKTSIAQTVLEDKFSAILERGKAAVQEGADAGIPKRRLAERGLELLRKPAMTAAEQAEVGRIVTVLGPDMRLDAAAVTRVQASAVESQAHLDELQKTIKAQGVTEIETYNALKNELHNDLMGAEERLKSGKYKGSAEDYKQSVIRQANEKIAKYRADVSAQKVALGGTLEHTLNALDSGALDGHIKHSLDSATHGRGLTGSALETTTRAAENAGISMRKLPGGKFVTASIVGYSFLPMALQGAAALRPGEAGEAATQALKWDALDAGVGFIPVIGELNDFRAAIMGTDLNGRELDTWSRVTAGAMGGLGSAALVLGVFTGGATIAGFKVLRAGVATKRALGAARMAGNATTVANVTQKTLKATGRAADATKDMERMLELSKTQKMARSTLNTVHNAQRGMQLYTYGSLGYSLASGAVELYTSAEGVVGTVQNKALEGISAAEKFITQPS